MRLGYYLVLVKILVVSVSVHAQFSHDDTLRGSITPERAWWDLTKYELYVELQPDSKSISGFNAIHFAAVNEGSELQVDLQYPMVLDSVLMENKRLKIEQVGANAYHVHANRTMKSGEEGVITVYYHGTPREAVNAPWDGGVSWSHDDEKRWFIATSCQGLGASVWWPCKDHMYDEPQLGMTISVNMPAQLMDVSNGRLIADVQFNDRRTTTWEVKNPINNYGVNMNVAAYAYWSDTFNGEKGILDLNFYVLDYNLEKAKVHFVDAKRTLRAFEYWFGPYPFYEDGYKLVEVPYLGMEHQSSVTYGNQYKKGYLGRDLSGTGWGKTWDYIIVHESGHEWFANNITYKDIADMWIHESFTTYSEVLFVEYYHSKKAGDEYARGLRRGIANNAPIIGTYDVNQEGSGDMYPKGANMLHTMRQIVNNDSLWRNMLRSVNEIYYHQTVTTAEFEQTVSRLLQYDFSRIYDQYLRQSTIPVLEIKKKGKKVYYRWSNVIEGFDMPLEVEIDGVSKRLSPSQEWQCEKASKFEVDSDYYIKVKRAN